MPVLVIICLTISGQNPTFSGQRLTISGQEIYGRVLSHNFGTESHNFGTESQLYGTDCTIFLCQLLHPPEPFLPEDDPPLVLEEESDELE